MSSKSNRSRGKESRAATGRKNRSSAHWTRASRIKSQPQIGLREFIDQFLEYARATFAPRNVENYQRVFQHALSFFGDILLSRVTPYDIERFKIFRSGIVSATTVNIDMRTLKAALNKAVDWEILDQNPCTKVLRVRIPSKAPCYLSRPEIGVLNGLIKEKWLKDVMMFAVATGLRQGEIIHLRWENVNLERASLYVRNSNSFRAKMGKERIVPLNAGAMRVLESQKGRSGYVFVYPNSKQIKRDYLTHRFKKYVREAGFNPEIHFHSLRHTFASWLVQSGVSLYYVQKLMGHSSLAMTEIYSHIVDDNLRESVEKIGLPLE
ncbi:MAG TPA: tyrosine-type recombinase/integrase [Bacteroidota bacterium]|jgi:integrase|nr:tyrosine-type recombinase/integrase [Bacteroidota bacterium]